MAKTKSRTDADANAVVKVQGVNAALLKYAEQDKSLAGMDEYRILPRIKLIQAMADQDLKKAFGEGTAIIRPGDAVVWKEGDEDFKFVPLLFVVEFAQWADLQDNEQNTVIARSFDPTSVIARKARDPKGRYEPYPNGSEMKYRFVEHLRFYGFIYGEHALVGTPVVLSFERGEFTQGKNFISAIKLRRTQVTDESGTRMIPLPLWSQVWAFRVGFRDKSKDRRWYGLDFKLPETPVIKDDEIEFFHSQHIELADLQAKNRLLVDERDKDVVETSGDNTEM